MHEEFIGSSCRNTHHLDGDVILISYLRKPWIFHKKSFASIVYVYTTLLVVYLTSDSNILNTLEYRLAYYWGRNVISFILRLLSVKHST